MVCEQPIQSSMKTQNSKTAKGRKIGRRPCWPPAIYLLKAESGHGSGLLGSQGCSCEEMAKNGRLVAPERTTPARSSPEKTVAGGADGGSCYSQRRGRGRWPFCGEDRKDHDDSLRIRNDGAMNWVSSGETPTARTLIWNHGRRRRRAATALDVAWSYCHRDSGASDLARNGGGCKTRLNGEGTDRIHW